ncbi:hypothetical protein D3C83_03150 [compost metagenome]
MGGEAPEPDAVGQQYCEVIQAEPAVARGGCSAALLDEVHQRPRRIVDTERRATRRAFEHVKAEHTPVVLDRTLEITDLQANGADVCLLGQAFHGGRTVERRTRCLCRSHCHLLRFLIRPRRQRVTRG